MNALFNVSDRVEKRREETYKSTLTPPLKQKQCFLPHPSNKNNSVGVPPANANCMQVTSHKPRVVLQPTRPIKVNISSRVLRTTKAYLELLPNSASSIQCPWLKISLLKVAEDKMKGCSIEN